MQIIYKQQESREKPLDIDVTSSQKTIYIRRDIKQIEAEDASGATYTKYTYQEAKLTHNEWEQYTLDSIVGQINGEENSQAYENFKNKLTTPIKYTNGKYYKPSWLPLYTGIIDELTSKMLAYEKVGGNIDIFQTLTASIYDVTGLAENAVSMTVKQAVELWLFLYSKKEEYFAEYKAEKLSQ